MPDMPETFAPRPYQAEAIQALIAGWDGPNNRLAVVLPTGAGKTVVFANLIHQLLDSLNGRALVIAHREELIEQAAAKIRAIDPTLRVGIVKAERNQHHDVDVIVASVQTLAVERRREAIRDIGLIIVDECHHAAAPSYMDVLEHFGAWRGVPVAGFTATMTRTDGGLSEVWQDIVYRLDILDLITAGHLVDVRGKRVVVSDLNLDKVKTRGGDLQEGQLGRALEESSAAATIAQAYREHASDRPGVVFTPTVSSAKVVAQAMTATGIATGVVWGDMPKEDRTATLKKYEVGDLQALANCMVLTEGFDAPHTSCAVIARPTKSPGLYVQMAGRALRLAEGKKDALILDVMGASTRHKLASLVDLSDRLAEEPKEGQSLREAAEEPEYVPTAPGVLEVEDFNLFADSPVRWLRTYGGTWFIPAGDDRLLFLLPDQAERGYRLRMWQDGQAVAPARDQAYPLADAMQWTEVHARRIAPRQFVFRESRWRAGQPSQKQLAFCRFNRIVVPSGSTAGDVSDLQAVHRASTRIDPSAAQSAA
ncbi:DEAD/DEAH box helicase [Streptomyces ipomoeae]|uniref:DEAD/DEAH box helicase n=1 Tax=Streptomyces ipomoeae TaxID=103232 RepID=UPI0029AA8613|nr:DEAD/DEAH box helicase [Streptomyces ipomoeae]MDX2839494.1 DEAD/DEAH box helicase [Streptomyces ipomoeae]